MGIDAELDKGNLATTFSSYHFLNFQTERDWKKISDSRLNFDASLGFAEPYGFRNSYGKAFQPYNVSENKPYYFVEAPLNFMDTTFHKYMKVSTKDIGNTIIDFYQKTLRIVIFRYFGTILILQTTNTTHLLMSIKK